MRRRRHGALAAPLVGLWGLLSLAGEAQAHLLPAQNATMNLVDNAAYFVVSVPLSALQGVDLDGDGQLSPAEIDSGRDAITRQFEARFRVTSDGVPGAGRLTWVLPPDDTAHESAYVVVLHREDFAVPPAHPVLATDLFGTGAGEAMLTLTATRSGATEVAVLTPGASSHEFFRGGGATFTRFVQLGWQHILGGLDHLLFLLTMVVASRGWRQWLAIATAFTVAHSVTLTLSVLGAVRLPPAVAEPAIAASIVVMALLNLRPMAPVRGGGWPGRLLLVFACGLLHGFGFASGIGLGALDRGNRLATLAGFNLGIELGQCLFLALTLLAVECWRQLAPQWPAPRLPRLASMLAAVAGGALLAERVYGLWVVAG